MKKASNLSVLRVSERQQKSPSRKKIEKAIREIKKKIGKALRKLSGDYIIVTEREIHFIRNFGSFDFRSDRKFVRRAA